MEDTAEQLARIESVLRGVLVALSVLSGVLLTRLAFDTTGLSYALYVVALSVLVFAAAVVAGDAL